MPTLRRTRRLALWNLNERTGATIDGGQQWHDGDQRGHRQRRPDRVGVGHRHVLPVVAGQAGRASAEAGAGHPDQQQPAQPGHPRLRRVVPLSHGQALRKHHAEGPGDDTRGGNFKFQLPKGNVTCLVRGSTGQRAVRTVGTYDNNQWHTVRCERTAAGITLTVSDANGNLQETKKLNGPTGNIPTSFPMTVGGKF